jgi:hypothetical protein
MKKNSKQQKNEARIAAQVIAEQITANMNPSPKAIMHRITSLTAAAKKHGPEAFAFALSQIEKAARAYWQTGSTEARAIMFRITSLTTAAAQRGPDSFGFALQQIEKPPADSGSKPAPDRSDHEAHHPTRARTTRPRLSVRRPRLPRGTLERVPRPAGPCFQGAAHHHQPADRSGCRHSCHAAEREHIARRRIDTRYRMKAQPMKPDTKTDVYQIITDRILALLDAGVNPWRKPWHAAAWKPPQNLLSRRPYRGVNVLLLGLSPYSSPYWVSFKQALQAGGSVKKGEKASLAVFWKLYDKTDKADPEPARAHPRIALLSRFQRGAVRRRCLPASPKTSRASRTTRLPRRSVSRQECPSPRPSPTPRNAARSTGRRRTR